MTIFNQEALNERARNLGTLNGARLVLVTLTPPINPTQALLELHFYNTNELATILAEIAGNPGLSKSIFFISGGHRITAGSATGQVQTTAVAAGPDADSLRLTVAPIGDYSTYTLSVNHANIDPIFSEIDFRFRPGCFTSDCAPDWPPGLPANQDPAIDYLAKDYDSFKHTVISAMMSRVPGWRPTSEADLDETLLELFCAAADELSDYQDRVLNEAYLGSARKRVSLARHARLMDYHVHQGNQASTWLALELAPGTSGILPAGLQAWTGPDPSWPSAVVFLTHDDGFVDAMLNGMGLYSWSGSIPALAAGSTIADLKVTGGTKVAADTIRDMIRDGHITRLLVQEWKNPATGGSADANPTKRQLLGLLSGNAGAETVQDPLVGDFLVRVRWREQDRLRANYCFEIDCPTGKVIDVSLFHGNLVQAYHGRPMNVTFRQPGAVLGIANEFYYEETERWGTLCRLVEGPVEYTNTPPGGEIPPKSTLRVDVDLPDGSTERWDEEISLVHSDDSDQNGNNFVVETDEEARSVMRFGNGVNGKRLPDGAVVRSFYQVGAGLDGNVGLDSITALDEAFSVLVNGAVAWNPFDVIEGRAPEPKAETIRRAPEAYRYRQLRAVTLKDYVDRAQELTEVSRAAARYAWTGSWRTVQIAIDPVGTAVLDGPTRTKIADHLEAVRLIGEDLEVRPPRFVPLGIYVGLCIDPNYWPEDIRFILEQEFSDGYTPDGRKAFFHPDLWTFGQELHASQIIGRIQAIEGVEHVISVAMKRWNDPTTASDVLVAVRPNEILEVHNDPDHMELGFIRFEIKGGRG